MGGGNSIRKLAFEKLSEYKQVDSGGRFLNNIGGPVKDKFDFQKKHKFSIAFENGSSKGYTTEKIVDAFAAKSIPIYWGNPDIARDFNPKSFINMMDFNSIDEMVEYVKEVDHDDALYHKILSEPIFENGEIPYHFQQERLAEFFDHIFDQPLEKAGRRCLDSNRGAYISQRKRDAMYEERSQKNLLLRLYNKIFIR